MRISVYKFSVLFTLICIGIFQNIFAQMGISPKQQKVCINDTAMFRVTNVIVPGSTFVWQDSTNLGWNSIAASPSYIGVTNDTLIVKNILFSSNTTKFRCIVDSAGAGIKKDTISSGLLLVRTALTNPTITSKQNICFGNVADTLKISIMPSGGDTGFTYQWQKSSNAITWLNLSAQTDTYLAIDTFHTNTHFRVQAISKSGCGTVTSNSVFVQYYSKLIAGHVISGITHYVECYQGNPDTIAVGINTGPSGGNGLFHNQWQMSVDTLNWVDLLNDTTETKTSVQSITSNVCYRLKSTSFVGCGIVYSDTIYVKVLSPVIVPTITGAQTVCFNVVPDTLKITTSTQLKNDVKYQWQSSINGTTWIDISGKTSKVLVLAKNGVTKFYRVKVTWQGCAVRFTDSVLVSVYQDLVAGSIKTAQNICYGATPSALSFQTLPSGGGDSFTYQWQSSIDSNNFNNIVGANSLLYSPSQLTNTMFYRVRVTSDFGCGTVNTNIIKVRVYAPYVGTDISASDTICYNTSPDTLRALTNPTGGNGNYLFQWQVSTNGISWTNVNGQSTKKYKPAPIKATTYYRLISFSGAGCGIDTSNAVMIKVLPDISKPTIANHQSICFNTPADTIRVILLAEGADLRFTYQWQISNNGTTWSNIPGQTTLKLFTGNLTTTKYYRVIASSIFGCGSIASDSVRIHVYEQFNGPEISQSQTICYDSIPSLFTITTKPIGANGLYFYQWQISSDSINFSNIFSANDTVLQTGIHTSKKFYRLRVNSTLGCGSVFSNIIRVFVYNKFEGAEIGSNESVCYGDVPSTLHTTKKPKGGSLTYLYQWQKSTDGINWEDIVGHTSDSLTFSNIYATTHYRMVNESTFGCGSDTSNIVTIETLSLPDTTVINGLFEVCKNQQQLFYNLENKNSLYEYEWEIEKGYILTDETKTNVFITWGVNSGNDTIRVKQTNKITGCFNYMKLPIIVKETFAPNLTEIIRKSTTNILVSKDSSAGIHYQWGYINKQTKVQEDIPGATLRYVQLPHKFDTTKYIYFVKTYFDDCVTTTYYNFDALSIGINNTKHKQLNIFPNPTTSSFEISGVDISQALIYAIDILGHKIPIYIDGNTIKFDDQQIAGIYFIVVNTSEGSLTNRVILSR